MRALYGDIRVSNDQFPGVLRAYIVDTDVTNPSLPARTARFRIPSYTNDAVWGPSPYPPAIDALATSAGSLTPKDGTQCIVGFEGMGTGAPLIISYTLWSA
jgi:hypothetical protein